MPPLVKALIKKYVSLVEYLPPRHLATMPPLVIYPTEKVFFPCRGKKTCHLATFSCISYKKILFPYRESATLTPRHPQYHATFSYSFILLKKVSSLVEYCLYE